MTMRMRSISRIGISVLLALYSASSVEVAVGKRRNRQLTRHGDGHQEENYISSGEYNRRIPRSLSVGLDNLRYNNGGSQYQIQTTRAKDNKGKGKGTYSSDISKGKGKGSSPSYGKGGVSYYGKGSGPRYGKGAGKGSSYTSNMDSEDDRYIPSTESPSSIPTTRSRTKIPTHHKKEHGSSKKGKHSKLRKSDKVFSTNHPIPQPTTAPTTNQEPTPSSSYTPIDGPHTMPFSAPGGTNEPITAPPFTPGGTNAPNMPPSSASGDMLVSLTPYTILYNFTDYDRPPFRSELLEVIELTKIYITNYFEEKYKESELTDLSEVMSIFTNTGFEFDEPIPIEFDSKAILKQSTVILPDTGDLDSILISAFEGSNLDGYIGLIQALPQSNIFSSTEHVKLIQMVGGSRTRKFGNGSKNIMAQSMTLGAIAVAGIAGLVLLFASSRLLRLKPRHESIRSLNDNKSSSASTGETFATRGSRQDDRMFQPICEELYDDAIENRR